MNNCLEKPFTNSGFALQDIVNQIGRRLGFEVEDGLYQGNKNDIGFDGLWKFPSDHHVVVEVKTTDVYRIDTDRIAEYRRRLIADQKITEEDSSILIVVGRDDTGDLEAQIRGSRHAWDIRLISIDSLLRLVTLKDNVDDPQIIQRICEILIPKEFTRLDHIVDIVFFTAEDTKQETDEIDVPLDESLASRDHTPFSRVEESVKFNEACAHRFGEINSVQMVRKSRTSYQASDKELRIVSLVSRDYEQRSDSPDPDKGSFWYGLRDYQKGFIDEVQKGYLILGCGQPDKMLVIPSVEVGNWLDQLNTTVKSNGTIHWHFHVFREGDNYYLEPKQGFSRLDITQFRI